MVRVAAVAAVACLAVALSACSLYFGPGSEGDDGPTADARQETPPDARPLPDAPAATRYVAYCGGGGVLYRTEGPPSDQMYSRGEAFGMCAGGCRTDSTYTSCGTDASCAGAENGLCPSPLVCPETGQACQGQGTVSQCTEQVTSCALTAAVRDCTCVNGAYQCRPSCTSDQSMCGPAGVAAAIGGTWRGTVTTGWVPPYQASVIFKPDHTYVSQSPGDQAAFYWGKDGTNRVYRWRPIGVAPGGGVATVDIYFGFESDLTGVATDIQRQGDRLRFQFWDAWTLCGPPIAFDLTLAP